MTETQSGTSKANSPNTTPARNSAFPVGILSASQEQLNGESLEVFEGALPQDIHGHAFFLAAAGNVDSQQKDKTPIVYPSADGTPLVNGNGMLYRIDFDQPDQAILYSRLAKTPCYFADEAIQANTRYHEYQFRNFGLARFSPWLGVRSMANTAIVSMQFADDASERLILTSDIGRPYEIDPVSLELVTPVGKTNEWKAQIPINLPFKMVMTTAHPRFDSHQKRLFTVNIGKSISTLIAPLLHSNSHKLINSLIKLIKHLSKTLQSPDTADWLSIFSAIHQFNILLVEEANNIPEHIHTFFHSFQALLKSAITESHPDLLDDIKQLLGLAAQILEDLEGIKDFVDLICWDGESELIRWPVMLDNGESVKITQTIHQIGLTRKYIVLIDTGFKVGPGQLIPWSLIKDQALAEMIRNLLDYQESPNSIIYLIPRNELTKDRDFVTAKQVTIPGELLHFLVDYENPNDQIILHLAHTYGWDPAEWVRSYDSSPYGNNVEKSPTSVPTGMMSSPIDQHAFARYVIDGKTGEVKHEASTVIQDEKLSWSIAMFAYEPPAESKQFEAIYWNSWGCWADLLTKFIVDLYQDYPKHFPQGKKALLDVIQKGIPDTLCQLKSSYPDALAIAQQYEFPLDTFATSPQFIPKACKSETQETSTNGYLLCTILRDDTSELWIFDANNLAQGAICKLRHPKLNFGFTTHTNWLANISPRTADYYISAREDYDALVKQQSPAIQKIFEAFVYPQFPDLIKKQSFPSVPPSLVTARRTEFQNLPLKCLSGEVPKDIGGHLFIINAAGSVDSDGLPYPSGDTIFNGDGMVYRLSFNQNGSTSLTSKLAKTPCYYADSITHRDPKFSQFKFNNLGLSRFSFTLGSRNQVNTAFLPMKVSERKPERLLITYDAGRPFEIDTQTLEIITPIGENTEWTPEISIDYVFPLVLTTAHPVFDFFTKQIFTVNFGRSLVNFLETIPVLKDLESIIKQIDFFTRETLLFNDKIFPYLFSCIQLIEQESWEIIEQFLSQYNGIESKDFVYLMCLDWEKEIVESQSNNQAHSSTNESQNLQKFQRWQLVSPEGDPISIKQSMHQIGITRDYIILLDTDLKINIEQTLNSISPGEHKLKQLIRELLARPVSPNSRFYIVRRKDLLIHKKQVIAQQLIIPLAAIHFLVDYDNPDGAITLHVAHNCAADIAEWIREYDTLAANPQVPVPAYLQGMITEETDISRMGRYVIDGETGKIISSKVFYDNDLTWGIGLYTYRERQANGMPPNQLEQIYWQTSGFWHTLATDFTVNLYRNYANREISIKELLDFSKNPETAKSRPSCLFRLDTKSMEIADAYKFPLVSKKDEKYWDGHLVSSPQFVPRTDGDGSPTDGYIVCTVFTPKQNEIWIFDAQDLAAGPCCKLWHPSLSFAYTMHTTWLPEIGKHTSEYKIPIRSDYQPIIDRQPKPLQQQIQQLFNQIYLSFE